ncbi:hypothetical protein ABIA39_002029 [Nocardia sp. GAS34]|uniref:hypothetical protein n=1 Tax=unclassified Nocardia TaxID=2637762 RepID=UPI003D1E2FD2
MASKAGAMVATESSLSYDRLAEVFAVLVAHARQLQDGDAFSFDSDYFWSVPVSEMNNIYSGPPNLTIGQVSESWSNLESMIGEDRVVSYGLIWLADVLRAIGKELSG